VNTVVSKNPGIIVVRAQGLDKWRQEHRARVPGYQHSYEFKRKRWDGYYYPGIRMHADRDGFFILKAGRGLLARIKESYPDVHIALQYPPAPALQFDFDLPDRDYQRDAFRLIGARRWGRIAFATNAGKGAIIALTAYAAFRQGLPSLILCDEVAVFDALKDEIAKWVPNPKLVGIVIAGSKQPPPQPIILAMVPTLYRRIGDEEWLEWLHKFQVVLADEADRATANTWRTILQSCINSHYRIGFSGSFPDPKKEAEKEAELKLEEDFGPVLLRVKNKVLIERGISAKPIVEIYPYTHRIKALSDEEWDKLSDVQKRNWIFDEGVVYNESRHAFIGSVLSPDDPNAIIVTRIAHGERLAQVLPDSRFLNGADSPDVRRDTLESFKRGDFQNLVVTKILDRGTNHLGVVSGLVLASGEGSTRQILQRVGRGLRRADGKEFLWLRDVADRGHPYFQSQSKKRLELYQREEFEIKIVREAHTHT
jgi:superfamily II DNA or RNA helicase